MAITRKPKKIKKLKTHGFLARSKSKNGRNTLKRRMRKGRKRLGQ